LCFVHSSDVGGKVPGSISPTSVQIFEEGLRVRPTKLVEAGVTDSKVLQLLLDNCRIPSQNWGDISAMLGAMNKAEAGVKRLCDRYGVEAVSETTTALLDFAESQARQLLRRLPSGTYRFTDYMEGDAFGMGPIRLQVTTDIRDGNVVVDFAGTEPQVRGAINLPTFSQRGHWMTVLAFVDYLRTVEPTVPYNSGLVRPIQIMAPTGSLVNPIFPAACGVRAATMTRIFDMLLGCLGQASPEIIPAAGAGQIAIALVACYDPAEGDYRVSVVQPLSGGSGARAGMDGIDGVDFSAAWLRNIPTELFESEVPVRILEYGFRGGSCGAGTWRGGCGITLTIEALAPYTTVTARGLERYEFAPWGRRGGRAGSVGETLLERSTGEHLSIGKFDALILQPGDRLTFRTQGGGGYGSPLERSIDAVASDVRAGFITEEEAHDTYGVLLQADTRVDPFATARRRSEMRRGEPTSFDEFTLGAERTVYEKRWTPEAQEAFVEVLYAVPPAQRDYLRDGLRGKFGGIGSEGGRLSPGEIKGAAAQLLKGRTGSHQ
jgi:N-methylhydantoinase B